MNPLNFVAVILKVLLVNLLAVLNFANVFLKIKKRLKNKKTLKNVKNVTKIKKRKTFYIYDRRVDFYRDVGSWPDHF